jgi:hypothetical protein
MTIGTAARSAVSCAVALHPFYIGQPRLWSLHLWELDSRIALNLEKRYCYVRVPKAANTAVTSTLFYHQFGRVPGADLEGKRVLIRPSSIPTFRRSSLDGFFCFTFVRNPYDRLLSAYLSKLVLAAGRSPYRELRRWIEKRHGGGELSFDAFCEYLAAEGPYGNPHWYPQCDFIDALGERELDFIGRVESIREDIARVALRIFGRTDQSTYREGTPTKASSKLGEHYCDRTRAIVRALYREDFVRLGYAP